MGTFKGGGGLSMEVFFVGVFFMEEGGGFHGII